MGTGYKEGRKMSLKYKVSISMCLLLTVSIFIYAQVPTVYSWGGDTHRFIETKAELVFSAGSFFYNYRSTLNSWCTRPDQGDRSFMPDGGGKPDWHYLDAYTYDPLPYQGKYSGELPWAMEWIFDNIVQYLEAKDWTNAVDLLGAICHFTGDATCPLHATYNFNPGNHHSDYETAVNNHIGEISIPDNYVPKYLDNITYAALVTLKDSFSFTKEGSGGGVNLTDYLLSGIYWNDWIKSMTENRVRASVQFTANVWYTAMIHAGLTIQAPGLISPSNGSTTTDNTPNFTWTSVGGTNFCDFQLAPDNGFTSGVVTVKGLSTTSYTSVEPLTNGEWYWRVRTGDNSTDVGLWSQTLQFTVSTQYIEVSISPSYQSGQPGENLDYIVTVVNFGNVEDNYDLTVSDNAGWTIKLSDNLLENVPAGENRRVTLRVTIPEDADNGTEDNITVTAISQENSQISANASCIAHAGFTAEEFSLHLLAGWNLIGFPVTNADMTPNNLFAGTTYTMYYWASGGYAILPKKSPVQDNLGYWVKVNQDTTITFSGTRQLSHTMYFVVGWNFVCFPNTSENTTPNNLFAGTTYTMYYWASGGYAIPPENQPVEDNRGYWVHVDENTTATVPL